jgi:hypothetical protein
VARILLVMFTAWTAVPLFKLNQQFPAPSLDRAVNLIRQIGCYPGLLLIRASLPAPDELSVCSRFSSMRASTSMKGTPLAGGCSGIGLARLVTVRCDESYLFQKEVEY